MSESAPPPRKTPSPGEGEPPANDEGLWEVNLWNGSAWFSDWFYQRLQWPMEVNRHRLDDLRPHLPDGAWEALLLVFREYLERQRPLDAQLRVQLTNGQIEWWRILGGAERNAGGQPMYLAGSMRDVTDEHRRDTSDGEP
jgi:PAS domain-containing protein